MMPGTDGYELCRQFRARPQTRNTKVIFVSARREIGDRLEGYEAGGDDYVEKPFDGDELLAKVRVFLRLRSLEEINDLKSDLLNLLNHETRTPLAGIVGATELLSTGEIDDEDRELMLQAIAENSQKLQNLLDRALDLAMMRAGSYEFAKQPQSLTRVVEGVLEKLQSVAVDKGVPLAAQIEPASELLVDGREVARAVHVVIDNAIRFSSAGETVRVGLRCVEGLQEVVVEDHGPGIPQALLPNLFTPFAIDDVAHHSDGHGLGLALANEIMIGHGGKIDVDSTEGEGSAFVLSFPSDP